MFRTTMSVSLLLLPLAIGSVHAADATTNAIKPVSPNTEKPLAPVSLSRDPVSFSWAIDANAPLDVAPSANVSRSKDYWINVSGQDFSQGISLPTSSPGALVKINPQRTSATSLSAVSAGIDPSAMTVMTQQGRSFKDGQGMSLMASSEQMQGQGLPFSEGTSIFQIKDELGAGRFTISSNTSAAQDQAYVVQVREKSSAIALKMQADKRDMLKGESITIRLALEQEGLGVSSSQTKAGQSLNTVEGRVRSPSGQLYPMTFSKQANGEFSGAMAVTDQVESVRGLWEVEASTTGIANGQEVWRNGKLVFSVTKPTARLTGKIRAKFNGDSPESATLRLNVVEAGRYEVRAVLFGSDDQGQLKPLMVTQSADYLEQGPQKITLSFDAAILSDSNLKAPYQLKAVRLIDQGQMGILDEQSQGVKLR